MTKKNFIILYVRPRDEYNEDVYYEFEAEDDPASIIKKLADCGLSYELRDEDTKVIEAAIIKNGSQLLKEAGLRFNNHYDLVPIDTPDIDADLAPLTIKPSICQKEIKDG